LDAAAASEAEVEELCRCLTLLSEEKARDLDFWTALKRYEIQGQASRLIRQLREWLVNVGNNASGGAAWRERLSKALLKAFPDQAAFARKGSDKRGECRFTLSGGGDVMARDEAQHFKEGYYLLLEILEQKALGGASNLPRVLSLIPLEEGWLLDCPARLREENNISWDATRKRVAAESRLLFGKLILSQGEAKDEGARLKTAEILKSEARKAGLAAFCPDGQPARYLARRDFALKNVKGQAPALPDEADLWKLLEGLCQSHQSFEALRGADILKLALDSAGHEGRVFLESNAPKSLRLPSGREAGIVYEPNQAPYVSSRLQDFFGLSDTPRLGNQFLALHLLAPNQRPVQITSDLKGFWEREYPRLRKELGRKYPRHKWPENPV
jgi:ATP-dependent helicase HrpB